MKLTSRLFVRIAAVLALLYAIGHTKGYPWTPVLGPNEGPVIDAMKSIVFNALGSQRTYWDFYIGFGIAISVLQFATSLILWLVGDLLRTAPREAVRILWVMLVGFAGSLYVSLKFFFAPPAIFTGVICLFILLALGKGRSV